MPDAERDASVKRCEQCGHFPHGVWCPNLASDNECACTRVTRCTDMACKAGDASACRYPGWMLCGFPASVAPTGGSDV